MFRIIYLPVIIVLIAALVRYYFPPEEIPLEAITPIAQCSTIDDYGNEYYVSVYMDQLRFDKDREQWYILVNKGRKFYIYQDQRVTFMKD